MQSSGYGAGVSEMQQFMVDGGCPSSLFSISASPTNASSSAAAEIQKFHPMAQHPHHPPHHLQAPQQQQQHFAHFGHPIPITQQLFQQAHHHHHHPFQLFHHQHQQQQQQQHLGLGLELEQEQTGQENSNSPGGPQSFLAAMNFKLGVNESNRESRDGLNDDDGILHGDDGSDSRLHHHHHHHNPWHREEESSAAAAGNIKEPFWRPLDIDFINPNNKRPAEDKQLAAAEISSSGVKHFKKSCNESLDHHNNQSKTAENAAVTDSNYKLFSELEAICKPGGTPSGGGGGGGGGGNNTNLQTGSGSALTGDDNTLMPKGAPGPAIQPDNVSDTSNGGDAPPPPSKSSSEGRKKRSKRKEQKQLSSMATFFGSLVKELMDHQESLHRKFLEVMEWRDQERTNREEAWRKQEAARANREAAARTQERALAASRESAILSFLEKITGEISFLEKITGESLVLPTKPQSTDELQKEHDDGDGIAEAQNALEPYNADSANNSNVQVMRSSRWPKAEVQALIKVRSGFETRFQEPGLKGPLWEEVSKEMAAMGYSRSTKRCKEKWENINKYFRKTKDSGKKRPQHSKTCPYFHQLGQLYSTSNSKSTHMISSATPPSSSNATNAQNEAAEQQRKDNSELLDAIVVSNDQPGKRPAVEISNEDEDEDDGNEEGQVESQGDDDRQRQPQLCDDSGGFHGLRS